MLAVLHCIVFGAVRLRWQIRNHDRLTESFIDKRSAATGRSSSGIPSPRRAGSQDFGGSRLFAGVLFLVVRSTPADICFNPALVGNRLLTMTMMLTSSLQVRSGVSRELELDA